MQVSTPSWPMAGSASHGRLTDGNTLGCVKDNDVKVSQHFFALRLTKDDLVKVLTGMGNASVATDTNNVQVVSNGGPPDVMGLVENLGKISTNTTVFTGDLSRGVKLISKPSKLPVPPWQMVSSVLGGVSLRAATWWVKQQDGLPSTPEGAAPAFLSQLWARSKRRSTTRTTLRPLLPESSRCQTSASSICTSARARNYAMTGGGLTRLLSPCGTWAQSMRPATRTTRTALDRRHASTNAWPPQAPSRAEP